MSTNRYKTVLPSLLCFLLIALTSCAPVIRIERLKPAPYTNAAKLTNITIPPFTGPGSNELRRGIKTALTSITVDGRPFFSTSLTGKQRNSNYGTGLPGTVDGYGTLHGSVKKAYCFVEHYTQKQRVCVESAKTDNVLQCIRWRHYKTDCFKSTGEYGFELKLIDTENNELVYALYSEGTQTSSACNDRPLNEQRERDRYERRLNRIFGTESRHGRLKCQEWVRKELLGAAQQTALKKADAKIRHDIAPHYVTESLRLMDSVKGIESKEGQERLKKGIEFAKNLWLLKAQQEWRKAAGLAPHSASVTYNLGVAAEFYGRYDEAAALYKKAYSQNFEKNKLILHAVQRVTNTIEENRRLTEQMKTR